MALVVRGSLACGWSEKAVPCGHQRQAATRATTASRPTNSQEHVRFFLSTLDPLGQRGERPEWLYNVARRLRLNAFAYFFMLSP